MKKLLADEKFDDLYKATYDDAVAYVTGMTGTMEYTEKILVKTYSDMYRYFRRIKEYSEQEMQDRFLSCLKNAVSGFIPRKEDAPETFKYASGSDPAVILEKDINISEQFFLESRLNRKIHSFVMAHGINERKIFILYFYCNYKVKQISLLLGKDEKYINQCICKMLEEIKERYFA